MAYVVPILAKFLRELFYEQTPVAESLTRERVELNHCRRPVCSRTICAVSVVSAVVVMRLVPVAIRVTVPNGSKPSAVLLTVCLVMAVSMVVVVAMLVVIVAVPVALVLYRAPAPVT